MDIEELCEKISGGNPATDQIGVVLQKFMWFVIFQLCIPSTIVINHNCFVVPDGECIQQLSRQGTTDGEAEMVQLGHKGRGQFSEMLVGHRNKKLKNKIPADAQLVHFVEKALNLKE